MLFLAGAGAKEHRASTGLSVLELRRATLPGCGSQRCRLRQQSTRIVCEMSHFVAAGADPSDAPGKDDDAWAKARATIEATKKPKPEVGRQEDGKSLYDVLQANKGRSDCRLLLVLRV